MSTRDLQDSGDSSARTESSGTSSGFHASAEGSDFEPPHRESDSEAGGESTSSSARTDDGAPPLALRRGYTRLIEPESRPDSSRSTVPLLPDSARSDEGVDVVEPEPEPEPVVEQEEPAPERSPRPWPRRRPKEEWLYPNRVMSIDSDEHDRRMAILYESGSPLSDPEEDEEQPEPAPRKQLRWLGSPPPPPPPPPPTGGALSLL